MKSPHLKLILCLLTGALVGVAARAAEPQTLDFGGGTVVSFVTPPPLLGGGEVLPEAVFDAQGRATVAGLTLQRTIEKEADGYRIKLAITNTRKEPVELDKLIPLRVTGEAGLRVAGKGVAEWTVYRLARHKNDIPGPFRPTVRNDASRDAAIDNGKAVVGSDDPSEGSKAASMRFNSDPGLVITADGPAAQPSLFIGFDGQTRHLNDVAIVLDAKQTKLEAFSATAEFDRVVLAPGETRETHYLYVQAGRDSDTLLARHVERIHQQLGGRLSPVRNVFCTWYFYGPEILEGDLRNDLRAMKERRIKFDTFLIDYNWDDNFGDWNADPARFPSGMKAMADEIKAAGLAAGIWTCPFIIESKAEILKKYPDLVLRDRAGRNVEFKSDMGHCWVLDPTSPHAEAFLTELCQRLTGWGYHYLKFDFLRAVITNEDAVFHDRTMNRAQAYRRGMEILRRAAGPDTVIGTWGGLFEANAGIVDINRPGSDVRGHWDPVGDYKYATRYVLRMRQTFARSIYDGILWTSDQDALQLRRRTKAWRTAKPHLAMGIFTDEEAFSTVVYRYLGGGVVQVSDKLDEVPQDRYDLYKMVIPAYAPVAKHFYAWDDYLPEHFVSLFPGRPGLAPWATVALCNWNGKEPKELKFKLADVPGLPAAPAYAAFDFHAQKFLGVFQPGDVIAQTLPVHGARVIRLTPLAADGVHLIGGDLNMSCGMEIAELKDGKVTLRPEAAGLAANYTLLRWDHGQATTEQVRVEGAPAKAAP